VWILAVFAAWKTFQEDAASMTETGATIEESTEVVNRVIYGDKRALAQLFDSYCPRLRRIVNFRLDRRIYGRVDADDVLQEAYLVAEQRMKHLVKDHPPTIFIWLRQIVNQTLTDVHRRHLGAQKRSAKRDVSLHGGWSSQSTSISLTFHLLDHLTSPSQAALKAELSQQIDAAMSSMSEIDREMLALRHFEELTNSEAAQVLNMTAQAASMRYVRAIARLRQVLETIPNFLTSWVNLGAGSS
jgi:RNA polymerase sigma-70 factor, ECF subfamily